MANFAVSTVFKAIDEMSEKFDKWINKGEEMEGHMKKNFHGASESAKMFGSVLAANLASRGIEMLGEGIKKTVEVLPEFAEKAEGIGRMAKVVGIGAEEFQKLHYAANLTDTSAEGLDNSLKKLNLGLGLIAKNQGPLYEGLKRVNPELMGQMRHAKSTADAFMLVSDAVKQTSSAQERAAIAVAAFGKQGQQMIPMLLQGREALEKMGDSAQNIIPDEAIENGEKFSDAVKQMKNAMDGFKNTALAGILEAVTPLMEKMSAWMTQNSGFIKDTIGSAITTIARLFEFVGPPIEHLVSILLPAVGRAVEALGPILTMVLGTAADLLDDIAPALDPLLQIFTALAPALAVVGSLLKMVTGVLSGPLKGAITLVGFAIQANIMIWSQTIGRLFELLLRGVSLVMHSLGQGTKDVDDMANNLVKMRESSTNYVLHGDNQPVGTVVGKTAEPANTQSLRAANFKSSTAVYVDNKAAPGIKSTVRTAPGFTPGLAEGAN